MVELSDTYVTIVSWTKAQQPRRKDAKEAVPGSPKNFVREVIMVAQLAMAGLVQQWAAGFPALCCRRRAGHIHPPSRAGLPWPRGALSVAPPGAFPALAGTSNRNWLRGILRVVMMRSLLQAGALPNSQPPTPVP